MKKNLIYIGLVSLFLAFTSCENGENEFPDFDYQTVYFANQYGLPVPLNLARITL